MSYCLYSGSPLYNLNKYIASILKAYVQDQNNNAKNYHVPIEDDEIIVSFDFFSLYTTFP